jgi:hypothetical protein
MYAFFLGSCVTMHVTVSTAWVRIRLEHKSTHKFRYRHCADPSHKFPKFINNYIPPIQTHTIRRNRILARRGSLRINHKIIQQTRPSGLGFLAGLHKDHAMASAMEASTQGDMYELLSSCQTNKHSLRHSPRESR